MDEERDWPVPYEELREASMQAQFEELHASVRALVAALPLPARIFFRMIGPYGLQFSRPPQSNEGTEPLCSAEFHAPYEGVWVCTLRPGHRGEHEDGSGHWWPREDQLETW